MCNISMGRIHECQLYTKIFNFLCSFTQSYDSSMTLERIGNCLYMSGCWSRSSLYALDWYHLALISKNFSHCCIDSRDLMLNMLLVPALFCKYEINAWCLIPFKSVIPHLRSPDVLGLQLPEIFASTANGEGFWEF